MYEGFLGPLGAFAARYVMIVAYAMLQLLTQPQTSPPCTRGLAKRRSCREHRRYWRKAIGGPRLTITTALAPKSSTASLLAPALQTLHSIRPSIRPLVRETSR
jgi:hypothetical protein